MVGNEHAGRPSKSSRTARPWRFINAFQKDLYAYSEIRLQLPAIEFQLVPNSLELYLKSKIIKAGATQSFKSAVTVSR